MRSAYDLIAMAAWRTPDHPALVDDRSDRRLTYRQLLEEIDVVAAGLARRGVTRGTRFATVLPNLFDHCLAILALYRLGAVPALINFRLKPAEIAALVRHSRLQGALILPDEDLAGAVHDALPEGAPLLAVSKAVGETESFDECRAAPEAAPPYPAPEPDEMTTIFYTSGTSGLPKGVVLAHRTHEPRIVWLSTMMGLRSGPWLRALAISPLSHAIGFHGIFLPTLAYGGTFYTLSAFDPEAALEAVERHAINYLFTLPTIFAALLAAPGYAPSRVQSLEKVYWGGAPMTPELLDRLAQEWPASLGHIYGTTEVMCALCNPEPAGRPDVLRQAYGARVRIADLEEPERTVPTGEEGELLVDATGDVIFSGYLDRPDATAEKIVDGWYRTGDGAVELEDGGIRILGRVDDMIRSGGEYIQPEEVETTLARHERVRACAVVGVPDAHWGQLAVACVVADGAPVPVEELDLLCRESGLANFKRPRGYVFLDSLPMSAANKLLRRELREIGAQAREGRGDISFHSTAGMSA